MDGRENQAVLGFYKTTAPPWLEATLAAIQGLHIWLQCDQGDQAGTCRSAGHKIGRRLMAIVTAVRFRME